MKSILDQFYELSLVSVIEDKDSFFCRVIPMAIGERHRILENQEHEPIRICFNAVSGYLVVPEVIQAGFDLKTVDDSVISEVMSSILINHLGFDAFFLANRHIVLRTAHQIVNVFIDLDDSIRLDSVIQVF